MKRLLTGLATASLLIGVPLAAAAHDRDDHGRGWDRRGDHGHWVKARPVRYYAAPPRVVYYPAPAPVVYRPVHVLPPPPVVLPHPPVVEPHVSVGFRILF
jgi:hypothetical protein